MRFALIAQTAVAVVLVTGCATTTTRLAPITPEEVSAEELKQRELALVTLEAQQARLDRLERRLALDEAVPPVQAQPEGGTAAAPTGHAETPAPSSVQPEQVASPAGEGAIDAVPAEPA